MRLLLPSWLIALVLGSLSLGGVSASLGWLHTHPAMSAPDDFRHSSQAYGELPPVLWWIGLIAAIVVPFVIAIFLRRAVGFMVGASAVLLLCGVLLWIRSAHHQDLIVYAHPTGEWGEGTYVGLFSSGGGVALVHQRRPFPLRWIDTWFPSAAEVSISSRKICRHTAEVADHRLTFLEGTLIEFVGVAAGQGGFAYKGSTPEDSDHIFTLILPYWAICLAFALLPAIWIVRRARRVRRSGYCPSCGYDLRATPERCPECGLAPNGL